MIWVFPSVGTPEQCVIRGRAFRAEPGQGSSVLSRNVRSLAGAQEWPGAAGTVAFLGRSAGFTADDEGFFAAAFAADGDPFPLGPHEARATLAEVAADEARGAVHVTSADGLSVISDFDDTLAETHVTQRRRMVTTALFKDGSTHPAVAGMACLYRAIARRTGAAFHYLSGSPIGFLPRILRFLEVHACPPGAVRLRHWQTEPMDPIAFKRPLMEEIAQALPGHGLVLFGDTGEKDPEVFAEVRATHGARVRRTFLRNVGDEPADAPRLRESFVFERASQAASEAGRLGLLDPADVLEVARAEAGLETR